MSTIAPSPEQAPAEEQQFGPHAFLPSDLRAAQVRASGLCAEPHAHQARQDCRDHGVQGAAYQR